MRNATANAGLSTVVGEAPVPAISNGVPFGEDSAAPGATIAGIRANLAIDCALPCRREPWHKSRMEARFERVAFPR